MQQPDGWTDDRVQTAKSMWKDGASASEISGAIGGGLSRNAVIGKLNRMGLTDKAGARSAPKVAAVKKPRAGGVAGDHAMRRVAATRTRNAAGGSKKQLAEMRPAIVKPLLFGNPGSTTTTKPPMAVDGRVFAPAADRVPVSLLALGKDCCKWPLGDPLEAGFGFCGSPVIAEGKPYCEHHHSRAYSPSPLKPLRRPSDRSSVSTASLAAPN